METTLIRVAALSILTGLAAAQTKAPPTAERQPGKYVVWASKADAICRSVLDTVNKLPNQAVVEASTRGDPAFLKWVPGPTLVQQVTNNVSRSFFPVTHLLLGIDDSGRARYVLRYSGGDAVLDEWFYVTQSLPQSSEEMRELLRSRPAFSAWDDSRIARLQQVHGAEWEEWFLLRPVQVSAMKVDQRVYFLAESSVRDRTRSSQILLFTIDKRNVQDDLCMLRRICGCGAPICSRPFSPREKAELVPSPSLCKK